MAISDRRKKEKMDLHRIILSAAREVFLEKGYDQTSIRNIAQKIDYSPTTIYLYFKDKDAIFHALHEEGFAILGQSILPLFIVEDPFQRLIAMGKIYMQFASQNPDYYDLMFVQKAPIEFLKDEPWQEGLDSFGGLMATVQQCMDQGLLKFTDAEIGAYMVWSAMHGMIILEARNRCLIITESKQKNIVELSFLAFTELLKQFQNT